MMHSIIVNAIVWLICISSGKFWASSTFRPTKLVSVGTRPFLFNGPEDLEKFLGRTITIWNGKDNDLFEIPYEISMRSNSDLSIEVGYYFWCILYSR
jgi:hypothetical protein